MVDLYARLIILGKKTLEDIPEGLKEQVLAVLEDYGYISAD